MTRLPARTAIALLASLALAAPARSDWPVSGLGVCTNPADQIAASSAPDGAGGACIAWVDFRSPSGIYLQRVTSGGDIAPGWPTDGLFLWRLLNNLSTPSVAPDGSGGAFVAWAGDFTVHAQHVTPSGEISAGWPAGGLRLADRVVTSTWSERAYVVPDGVGGAIVAWTSQTIANIGVQRLTADGVLAPGWLPGGVPVSATGGTFGWLGLASDGAGGAIVAWTTLSAGNWNIYAQRIAANGTRAAGWPADGRVVCGAAGVQQASYIAADGEGGAFIVWSDQRNLAVTGIDTYLQRITAAGTIADGWPDDGLAVCTASGDQGDPRVIADGTGGAIISWPDWRTGPEADLYAQRVTSAGTVAPGWGKNGIAVCDAPEEQTPSLGGLVSDDLGGVLLCWSDSRDLALTGRDIYAQRLEADGTLAPGWPDNGLALCAATGDQKWPWAVSNGAGGAIVSWEDGRMGTANDDIYAARVNADGSTPVLMSLVSAEAREGLVRLHWYAADSPALRATVDRRTPETDWMPRGSVSADGAGHLRFEDTEIVPGGRYGYRLGIVENGVESFVGEVWVVVPVTESFSLTAAWSPGDHTLRVSFSLPADGPATLELFDPGGRRLATRSLGGLGPGSHTLALDQESPARAGVHLLRLRQGQLEARTKAISLR